MVGLKEVTQHPLPREIRQAHLPEQAVPRAAADEKPARATLQRAALPLARPAQAAWQSVLPGPAFVAPNQQL